MNIRQIEKIIGYEFASKDLLTRAFTHSSYANEKNQISNEQLEFLGDGLLGFIVAEKLYATNANEGNMTVKRSCIVNYKPLCRIMDSLRLSEHILFGQSEKNQSHAGKKVLSDVFESMVGAVYLDGGINEARAVILRLLGEDIKKIISETGDKRNYKGNLQEFVQGNKLGDIEYVQSELSGSPHEPLFKIIVKINGEIFGEGGGRRMKDAEQEAAKCAFEKIQNI